MALRFLTAQEIGQRVAEVMRRAGMRSVKASLAMGRDKQFLSRWTTGKRKRIDRDELVLIANYAEGKGDFVRTDARTILAFLEGDIPDWGVKLRPNLRLVEDDNQPGQVESSEPDLTVRRLPSLRPRREIAA